MSAGPTGPEGPSPPDARASTAPALRLVGVSKRFGGVVANDAVSLEAAPGEILALLGENGAGKTTLMNIAFGLVAPDAGEIEVAGEPVAVASPRDAFDLGIGMVHQHFKLVPDMTVAENVALTRGSAALGRLRLAEVRTRLTELSDRFGLEVHPDALVEELSVGEQQRVELMKLLFRDVSLLILDEPTGVLTPPEWRQLATVLRALADQGRTILFISHKLDEVTQVADRCTVLRDGRVVGTRPLSGVTKEELARLMVGRDVTLRVDRGRLPPGRSVLEVRDLTASENGRDPVEAVSLTVAEREVLGVAGVDGNGQQELVEAITGVRERRGLVSLDGRPLRAGSPASFIAGGGAVVPADRSSSGLAQDLSVAENLLLKDFARPPFASGGLLDRRRMREHASGLLEEYDVRAAGLDVPVHQLSGGNQQKLVLARELARRPKLLIAAQPTRGLDVGAAEFVYERLARFKREGGAILLISTELDEVLSLSDRIAVIVEGRLSRVLDAGEADAELLGMLIGGERMASPAEALR